MRVGLLLFVLILPIGLYACVYRASLTTSAAWIPTSSFGDSNSPAGVSFDAQVKPIFEKGCKPCHFSGGAMYQQLPFDRPETIKKLGTKLFTRIKDEEERRLIRVFLEQG